MQRSSELTCAYMSQLAVSNHLARIETPASETWLVDFSNFHCSYWSYLKSLYELNPIDRHFHSCPHPEGCWPLRLKALNLFGRSLTPRHVVELRRTNDFSSPATPSNTWHCWLEDSFLIRGCASPLMKSQLVPSRHSQFEMASKSCTCIRFMTNPSWGEKLLEIFWRISGGTCQYWE